MRDPKYLHPKLQIIHAEFIKRCEAKGIKILTYMTRRSLEEQAELYAKGRTEPGNIVTNAKPGYSWHNFDLAFDCVQIKNGICLWENHNWELIGKIGKELGLIWGGDFQSLKDKPHFEYHPNLTLEEARKKFGKEDLLAHVDVPNFAKEEKNKVIINKKENVIEVDFVKKTFLSKHPLLQNIIHIIKNLLGL